MLSANYAHKAYVYVLFKNFKTKRCGSFMKWKRK